MTYKIGKINFIHLTRQGYDHKRLGVHNAQEAVVKAKILGILEQ